MSLEEVKAHVDKFLDECKREEAKDLLIHVIEGMDILDVETVVRENVMELDQ